MHDTRTRLGFLLLLLLFSSARSHRNYDRLWNELLAKITEAEQKGEETDDPYALRIEEDLRPFAGGISREDVEALSKWGTRYQVIGGAVFRSTTCVFPSRCEGVEYFLRRLAPRLGDTEFILNSHDVPRIEKGGETPRPLFSFSKNDRFWDVMYPAWAFWKGGPALSIYPTGIGDWNKTSQLLLRTSEEWPWERKEDRGFFLGSRTSSARDPLVLLSRRRPEFVLASYTKNQGYRGPKDTLHAEPAKEEPFEKNCQYRYLFNFRGVAASFRFKHLFLCGSLVFHVDDGWKEFFYGQLTPWLHYVPISVQENTEEHLEALLEFFQEHQDLARRIAERGQKRIWERLGVEDVEEYWLRLLTSYSSLLNFSPVRDETLFALT